MIIKTDDMSMAQCDTIGDVLSLIEIRQSMHTMDCHASFQTDKEGGHIDPDNNKSGKQS